MGKGRTVRRRQAPGDELRTAALRYVNPATTPGIRRVRKGKGFSYAGPDGSLLRDPAELRRIRALVIPPAWRDVWICPDPNGHLQATGRDAKRRLQHRYHPRWREVRDELKYERSLAFAEALAVIRRAVERDLALSGLPRRKMIAAVVRLLETTLARVGNSEYAKENGSYGLTTLRSRHVNVNGHEVRFRFKGKAGKENDVSVRDRRVARVIKRALDLPGYELFQYVDEDGARRSIDSSDVNEYLREVTGAEFTAKDFRTWAGTVLAARQLMASGAPKTEREGREVVVETVKTVAQQLGNTPAVCRKCYIHPIVLEAFVDGSLFAGGAGKTGGGTATPEEVSEEAVLAVLRRASGRQEQAA